MGNSTQSVEQQRLRRRLATVATALVAGMLRGPMADAPMRMDWKFPPIMIGFGLFAMCFIYVIQLANPIASAPWGQLSWKGPFKGWLNQFDLSAASLAAFGVGHLIMYAANGDLTGVIWLSAGVGVLLGTRLVNYLATPSVTPSAAAPAPNPGDEFFEELVESFPLQFLSWLSSFLLLASAVTVVVGMLTNAWVNLRVFSPALLLIAVLFLVSLFLFRRLRFTQEFALAMLCALLVPVGFYMTRIGWLSPVTWVGNLYPRLPLEILAAACLPFCTYAYWAFCCAAEP